MAALSPRYLADTSALARLTHPAVQQRLLPLLEEGLVATCAVIDLEVLYSARSLADYEASLEERQALPQVPITESTLARALDVQHQLDRTGHHRLPIPDLMVAATAESADLVVLHYDADYERIAAVTGQPHEWVCPRGSL